MKKILALAIAASLTMVTVVSHAQVDTARKAKSAMSKSQKRAAIKEKWDNATPEQKEKIKQKKAAAKAKFDSMTPEQKQAAKDKMKAKRAAKKAETPTPAKQ